MRRLFLLILILLAVYVAYPYWTLHRLEQALLSNNAEALKRIVDSPAIRASMKDPNKADAPKIGATMTLDGARWRVTNVTLPPLGSLEPTLN